MNLTTPRVPWLMAGVLAAALVAPVLSAQVPPPPPDFGGGMKNPKFCTLADLKLTGTLTAGGIQLSWISPDPANPGVTFDVQRQPLPPPAQPGTFTLTQPFVSLTPNRINATSFLDTGAPGKGAIYKVSFSHPSGACGTTNPVTVSAPLKKPIDTGRPPPVFMQCRGSVLPVTVVDLEPGQQPTPHANVYLHVHWNQPTPFNGTVTISLTDLVSGAKILDNAPWIFGREPQSGTPTFGYDLYRWIGVTGDQKQVRFAVSVVATEPSCVRHTFDTVWQNANGVLP
jgi:hypothetical protein